jgi:hypothetical protein
MTQIPTQESMLAVALVFGLSTKCQVIAPHLRVPSLVLLLPGGFLLEGSGSHTVSYKDLTEEEGPINTYAHINNTFDVRLRGTLVVAAAATRHPH